MGFPGRGGRHSHELISADDQRPQHAVLGHANIDQGF
jgi:hypothetical protein